MYRAVFYYVNSRAVISSLFYNCSFHIGKTLMKNYEYRECYKGYEFKNLLQRTYQIAFL